ncbi:toll/interleukin-1 receptor domain-containing protein [Aliarcobacter butzleri]|uniref:toll/interleukin-1 receptor domain-containing protein n=1 Tax=Aliarcobacter butzleri TaxID=28197 RepID=UPI003AF902E3
MDNEFDAALDKISNIDLEEFQEKFNKVKKINIQRTIKKLEDYGKTDSSLYKSLLAVKDLDFEKFQKSLDSVKEMGLGLSKDLSKVYNQITASEITCKKTIFISYSHNDSKYLDRLRVHLKPLEKQGLIELWDDTKIQTGDLWRKEILTALENSAIAILLISADFLASDFISENELPPLLNNAKEKGTLILPVIVKASRFEREKSLSQFQALNSPNNPISNMNEHEQEVLWNTLSSKIEELL